MEIQNLTVDKWKANHPVDHKDKWYRELYPFHVFRKIDFDICKTGIEQEICFNEIYYYATIKKVELQETGRYSTTFEISTTPISKSQTWEHRIWNTTFQIIYTKDFKFITVYTKKDDPSEVCVNLFKNSNFNKISEDRSLQISDLLFRTLLYVIAEENFPNGKHDILYHYQLNGIRKLPENSQFKRQEVDFAPIYSIGRELWICHSFTEEKAHRIAFYIANQCKKLIIAYCNPTYTKHHRCVYENTYIISLYEFSEMLSPMVRKKYESHIRFLQNHLNPVQILNIEQLLAEINNPSEKTYEIKKSDLSEALGIMKIIPSNNLDFFHSLAAINLINAFINQKRKRKTLEIKEMHLYKEMYYFKTYLADIITERIKNKDFSIPIFIDGNTLIIEIFKFQFSFHSIPLNEVLKEYEISDRNNEIIWSGKRLQPLAPLLLYYSRALRQKDANSNSKQ